MADYTFVTRWSFQSPIEPVWRLLAEAEKWPAWWRGVERVELLEPGDQDGIGALRRFTWKSKLPYRLRFDMRTHRVEPSRLLQGEALGELQGSGLWELREEAGWTHVRYDWQVRTSKAWMNLLAPLARPVFAWNHDVVMRWGGEGLARRLGCPWREETA